jgi:S-adenosyl-L-methionine hydrolase (adenosine-forming)
MTIITLTTDFGLQDGYVAAMRGVILSLAPATTIVDVSQLVRPGNVRQAAYLLGSVFPYFPPDTIHVAVVDPGVGSQRRALALRTPLGTFVGPDNGLLPAALDEGRRVEGGRRKAEGGPENTQYATRNKHHASRITQHAIHLTNPAYWLPIVSSTFHGRDIFAPVAAHLALGVPLEALGEPIDDPMLLPSLGPRLNHNGQVVGEILHIDHFGNLISSIVPSDLLAPLVPGETTVEVGGQRAPLLRTFSDVASGTMLAYIGSSGHLEIAIRDGNAATVINIDIGAPVTVSSNATDTCP